MISLIRHILYYSYLLIYFISLNLIISSRDDNILWPYWIALWFSFFLYPSYSIWYKYIIFLIYHPLNLVKFTYNDKILVFVIFYFWIWICITKNVQIKLIDRFFYSELKHWWWIWTLKKSLKKDKEADYATKSLWGLGLRKYDASIFLL